MDKRLPPELLPELRAKWVKLAGAREVVQHAAMHMQRLDGEYQTTLNVCLRVLGLDPAMNYKVNLESGEIAEVTAADVMQQSQGAPQGAVPWVAPTNDSPN